MAVALKNSLWLWLPAQNVVRQHLNMGWERTNEALFPLMDGWLEVNGCWKQCHFHQSYTYRKATKTVSRLSPKLIQTTLIKLN